MEPKLKATRSDVEVAENEDVSVNLEPEWSELGGSESSE